MNGKIKLMIAKRSKEKDMINKLTSFLRWKSSKQRSLGSFKFNIARRERQLKKITQIKFI